MDVKEQILYSIKKNILEVLPDAKIYLFGSRVNNQESEESDWDILIISPNTPVTSTLKNQIHDVIFPISVSIGSFINIMVVNENDWYKNPGFYALRTNIAQNTILL